MLRLFLGSSLPGESKVIGWFFLNATPVAEEAASSSLSDKTRKPSTESLRSDEAILESSDLKSLLRIGRGSRLSTDVKLSLLLAGRSVRLPLLVLTRRGELRPVCVCVCVKGWNKSDIERTVYCDITAELLYCYYSCGHPI